METDEDETTMLRKRILAKIQAKSRKRYLQPDSIERMPCSSKLIRSRTSETVPNSRTSTVSLNNLNEPEDYNSNKNKIDENSDIHFDSLNPSVCFKSNQYQDHDFMTTKSQPCPELEHEDCNLQCFSRFSPPLDAQVEDSSDSFPSTVLLGSKELGDDPDELHNNLSEEERNSNHSSHLTPIAQLPASQLQNDEDSPYLISQCHRHSGCDSSSVAHQRSKRGSQPDDGGSSPSGSSSNSSSMSRTTSQSSLSLSDDFGDSDSEYQDNDNRSQDNQEQDRESVTGGQRGAQPPPDGFHENDPQDNPMAPEPGDNMREALHGLPSHPKLREALQGDMLHNLENLINTSRGDLLYMALGLALKNKISNTALFNLIELLNTIFATPVLPTSTFLLDELLKCDVGVNYFFYCESCFESFGELAYKNIKIHVCENCNHSNPISDLRVASFFVTFDIPMQLEILFSDPSVAQMLVTPKEANQLSVPGILRDIYDGTMYQEFVASIGNIIDRVISMHFCTDGSPLASSSTASIWPIQASIIELPPDKRMKHLILAGLWFGTKKPPMDLFLSEFVNHMKTLAAGFELRVGPHIWPVRVYILGCCVDSGARGSVQGIKTHGGYFSCNWCKIRGVWISNAVKYPLSHRQPEDRNHEDIVSLQKAFGLNEDPNVDSSSDEDENGPSNSEWFGVQSVSPLITLPKFNMVDGFFLDTMHCVDLGLVRGFLAHWFEDAGQPYNIKGSIPVLNKRMKSLRPPLEFRRMPRVFQERARWKASECNNFLYFSPAILKGILHDKYLNIWMLLVQAMYMLNRPEVSIDHVHVANRLITYFLAETQELYSEKSMTFNLHILKHLGPHVARWGPPWATSAYAYEAGNGKLKSIIHSAQGVPHQVVRNISWEMALNILHPNVSQKARDYVIDISKPKLHHQRSLLTTTGRLIGKPVGFQLTDVEVYLCTRNGHSIQNLECYQKLIYQNCCYVANSKTCARTNNSVAQLRDKSIILIRKILHDRHRDEVFIIASDINWHPMLNVPYGIVIHKDDHALRLITSIDEELKYVPSTNLKIICCRTLFQHMDFLVPLPNLHNRF